MSWVKHSLLGIVMAIAGGVSAAETIAYQGRLASNSGGDPPSGTYLMQFSLFPFEGGGEPLWAETRTVPVEAGLYTVELGAVTPFADQLFAGNPNLWLETALDSSGNGVFETTEVFTPRVKLTAAPYAFAGADGGTVGGGVEVEPNTPPASVQRLARTYTVGDGSVGLGNLVCLYEDGMVRQSASRLPWAKDEKQIVAAEYSPLLGAFIVRHYNLAKDLFVVHAAQAGFSYLVAGRLNSQELTAAFGEPAPTRIQGSVVMYPASVVLDDGESNWPLVMSVEHGTESYYGATLSTVNPETLQVTNRSTQFISSIRFNRDIAICKVAETDENYTVVMGGSNRLAAYSIEKRFVDNIPDVEAPVTLLSEIPTWYTIARGGDQAGLDVEVLADGRIVAWTTMSGPRIFELRAGQLVLVAAVDSYGGNPFDRDAVQPLGGDRFLVRESGGFATAEVTNANTVSVVGRLAFQLAASEASRASRLSPDRFIWNAATGLSIAEITGSSIKLKDSIGYNTRYSTTAVQDGLLLLYRGLGTSRIPTVRISRVQERFGYRLGVAMADAEAGETVPVAMDGVVSGYSGLIPSESYYGSGYDFNGETEGGAEFLRRDGSITATITDAPIGRAISETEILLDLH